MKDRYVHIDIAKGISICLVATFHGQLGNFYPSLIEPMGLFRMPLFFLLSGVFFSWRSEPHYFFTKKFDSLLKPYFVVLFSLLLIDFIFFDEYIGTRWIKIIYANGPIIDWTPLWFLSHLFLLYGFSYVLFKYFRFYQWPSSIKYIYLISSITIGSIFIDSFWIKGISKEISMSGENLYLPGLPFSLDIILVTSVFFILGIMLRDSLISFKPSLFLIVISIIVFYFIQTTPATVNFNHRMFSYPFLSTLGAISGIYLVMSISYFIQRFKRVSFLLSLCGQSSLFILIFHQMIGRETNNLMIGLFKPEDSSVIFALIALISSIFIPIYLKTVAEKFNFISLMLLPIRLESKTK